MTPRLRDNLPLALVLLLALALRVWGIGWGLPSETHYFSYHPDESVMLLHAMSMSVFQGRLLPNFYNYGTLQLYLVLLANTLVFVAGHGALIIQDYATQHALWAQQYLVGRLLTVVMGVGTVWATFAVGARLWNRRAGLWAAGLLAVMPLHAQHSHWLTVDVPATFWAMLSLAWAARLAPSSSPLLGRGGLICAAVLAGVFAGLAAATKYNMALALLPVFAALVWPRPEARRAVWLGLAAVLACGAAFLLACPGVLLEHTAFVRDFSYEAYHVQHLPDLAFQDTGNGFVYEVRDNLDDGLGLPLLLLSVAGIIWAAYRRQRGDGLLAAFALPSFVIVSLAAARYARYIIPELPILALWCGRMIAQLMQMPQINVRRAAVGIGAFVLIWTLGDAIWLVRPMAAPDNRDVALQKILALNMAPVGFAVQPWFSTPPVSPWFCAPIPGAWMSINPPSLREPIFYARDWDLGQVTTTFRPPMIVLSEDDYADPLRLHQPAALAYVDALRQNYRLADIVSGPDAPAASVDGLPTRGLPPDMLYPDPIVLIFTRK